MKFKHLIWFELVYLGLFILLFPGFRYNIDPDATGYLSVAEHCANGDYFKSINGIWSPLSSWLVAPLIKAGFDGVLAVKYLNGLYGLLSLGAFFFLIKRYAIEKRVALALLLTAVILILYFVYYRLFGDLLQLFLLLTYLNLITGEAFTKRYLKIFLAALIGGVCFYAKAVSFYFILLHLPLVILILEKNKEQGIFRIVALKKIVLSGIVLMVMVAPWALAIKSKYGNLALSNNSLTGLYSLANPEKRVLFYRPPYEDGYSVWDDLSTWNVSTVKPYSNKDVAVFLVKVIFSNFKILISTLNNFSLFFNAILLATFVLFIKKRHFFFGNNNVLIILSTIIIWCAMFLVLHVEARFMWIIALLGLLLLGILLSVLTEKSLIRGKLFFAITLITVMSFWVYPIDELKAQYRIGVNVYKMAEAFKQQKISGNIISRNYDGSDMVNTVILNYWIKGKYYGPVLFDFSTDEIFDAIEKYRIDYYILYFKNGYQKDEILTSLAAKKASAIFENVYPNVIVLSFKKGN